MDLIKNVYLVDDDQDDRIIFSEVLSQVSPDVKLWQFADGEELTRTLCESLEPLPDLIFLNIRMPLKNGFDCLKEIRSRKDEIKNLKIIIFSSSYNPDDIITSRELGADFYAIKPVSIAVFRSLIQKILKMDMTNSRSDFVLN